MAQYSVAVHGVSGVAQTPSEEEGRYGDGLHLYNSAGKLQWVHFSVPNQYDASKYVSVKEVFVKASLNENARIVAMHAWYGNNRLDRWDQLDERGPVVHLARAAHPTYIWINIPLGVDVCLLVEYLSGEPTGHVAFHSAGATLSYFGGIHGYP